MRRIVIMVLLLTAFAAVAQDNVTTYTFVERDSALRLDVWRPATPRADSACVIEFFGGGFVTGTRHDETMRTAARMLNERGYTVVSADYRLGLTDSAMVARHAKLSGVQDLFQWCIDIAAEDCAAACAWVVEHAKEIGVSPQRIILTGSSAGAITVLQMDYYRANGKMAAVLPEGWKPAAVVPYAGAIMCKGKPRWKMPPAPTMLMHGTKDKIVAYKKFPALLSHALYGADVVAKQMLKQGYPCWVVRFEGIGHEVASWQAGSMALFCAFVEQVLAGRVSTLDATMTDSKLKPTKWTDMTVMDLYKR